MIFTFSFDENLNFDKFKRHAIHYLEHFYDRDIEYHLLVKKHKLTCKVIGNESPNMERQVKFQILEVTRDDDKYVVDSTVINPNINEKFRDIKLISQYYDVDADYGKFTIVSADFVFNFMCNVIRLLSKIEKLCMFA